MARRRRLGGLVPIDAGGDTLAAFTERWWQLHALPRLAPSTRRSYSETLGRHLLPRLGGCRLRELTPAAVDDLRAEIERASGAASASKTLAVLSSILSLAVVRGELSSNPVRMIRKPRRGSSRAVRPLPPEAVEALRAALPPRDATLVGVLAYAGLRPSEALALRWSSVRDGTLLIEGAVVLGQERTTKTGRSRVVRLLAPLARDLLEWRLASGRPDDESLVFPRPDGRPWADADWRNWRRREFGAALIAAELPPARPYDLRHSFVSLLIASGMDVVAVAKSAGHSPSTCLSVYGHCFEQRDPASRVSPEEWIAAARAAAVTTSAAMTSSSHGGNPHAGA